MTTKAEKAALESSRQLLRTGVRYLAAVTRRVQGLRAVERAVSTANHGGSALSRRNMKPPCKRTTRFTMAAAQTTKPLRRPMR
jgi:hypothetical protein